MHRLLCWMIDRMCNGCLIACVTALVLFIFVMLFGIYIAILFLTVGGI